MKQKWMRIAAFVLTLCLLLTQSPAAAFTASAAWMDRVVYDFCLEKTSLEVNGDSFAGKSLSNATSGAQAAIKEYYNNAAVNWYYQSSVCSAAMFGNGTNWNGISVRSGKEGSEYLALKISSPGAGAFELTLNYQITDAGTLGQMYILPGDTSDIPTAVAASVPVISFNCLGETKQDAQATASFTFADDTLYTLVFYSEDDGRLYMNSLEAVNNEKTIQPVVATEAPVTVLEGCTYGTSMQVNGDDYLFMPVEGGRVVAFNMDRLTREYDFVVPYVVVRGITVDDTGKLWMSGDNKVLYCYDPLTRTGWESKNYGGLASGASSSFDLIYADGCLYFGTYPAGYVMKYDIRTDTFTALYKHNDANYINGLAYKNGYVYAGVYGDADNDKVKTKAVVKVDAVNGGCVSSVDASALMPDSMFYDAGFAGDLLLMSGEKNQNKMVVVDTTTMKLVELEGAPADGGIYQGITEEVDGKVYFVINGYGLCSLDVNTRKLTTNIINTIRAVRCSGHSIIQVDDPAYPGNNIVLYAPTNGAPMLYNLDKKTAVTYNALVEGYSVPTRIHSMITGTDGIYVGAYNTDTLGKFDTASGVVTQLQTSGQTDSICEYNGSIYTGNYSDGNITRIDPDGTVTVLLTLNDNVYDQSRIHTLTAGGGKVFAGTIPDSYGYGGCIAWVDVKSGETYVERNVVQDQSINKLIYDEDSGLLYGSTTTYGGNAKGRKTDESAVLFIYDVQAKKKIAEFDLRNYLTGFTGNVHYIAGIARDPEDKGLFWGLISETLFTFRYENGKLTVKEQLSFGKNTYNSGSNKNWSPRSFCFDGKGNLYLGFDSKGGMRRINTSNPNDNVLLPVGVPAYYTLGADGNLYYGVKNALYMYPLNITAANWQAAEIVDTKILQIEAGTVTAAEARAAYNALSLTEKALVQSRNHLEDAEVAELEAQINALPVQITNEHRTLLQTLWNTYSNMTQRQQESVSNYDALISAINAEQSYVRTPYCQVEGEDYYTLDEAMQAAAAAQDKTVKLVADITAGELLITDGITLDLNGYTLSALGFHANIQDAATGYVVDSSAGNEGLLRLERFEDVFQADNPDLPVYDAEAAGYRFFDYKLSLHATTTNDGQGREKFWFKFHFYTDDTCTAQDQDAYDLIYADGTNMEVSVDFQWNNGAVLHAAFGRPDASGKNVTALFSQGWAEKATLSRWIYLTVSGLDTLGDGTLKVMPQIQVNGVRVTGGAITYVQKTTITPDYGWSDGIV